MNQLNMLIRVIKKMQECNILIFIKRVISYDVELYCLFQNNTHFFRCCFCVCMLGCLEDTGGPVDCGVKAIKYFIDNSKNIKQQKQGGHRRLNHHMHMHLLLLILRKQNKHYSLNSNQSSSSSVTYEIR